MAQDGGPGIDAASMCMLPSWSKARGCNGLSEGFLQVHAGCGGSRGCAELCAFAGTVLRLACMGACSCKQLATKCFAQAGASAPIGARRCCASVFPAFSSRLRWGSRLRWRYCMACGPLAVQPAAFFGAWLRGLLAVGTWDAFGLLTLSLSSVLSAALQSLLSIFLTHVETAKPRSWPSWLRAPCTKHCDQDPSSDCAERCCFLQQAASSCIIVLEAPHCLFGCRLFAVLTVVLPGALAVACGCVSSPAGACLGASAFC
jgi:hypothetical protein